MRQPPFLQPAPAIGPEPRRLRRATAALAVSALLLTLLAGRIAPAGDLSAHELVARPLNLVMAWIDLHAGLGHEALGATRAVTTDPGLGTAVGRQGARWLAANGTPAERLAWAGRLAGRDSADRPLLAAAVTAAWCGGDPALRRQAAAVAKREHLEVPTKRVRSVSPKRSPC
jgi:hypothetical protein